jgi:hypothetical protein
VWDDTLSKLIGWDAPTRSTGGPGEDGEAGIHEANDDEDEDEDPEEDGDGDEDEDDEAEPDVPAGGRALSGDIDIEYDPRDPAGLRLGKLSVDDAARYHLIKSACMKTGRLEEWKQCLNSTVVELSSTLSTQSLTNARSKKAVKRIIQELQQYVRPTYIILESDSLISCITQAKRVYGLYGISVSGIILGTNMVAPSTALHPSFFGPEPKFVNLLQNMLWHPQEVQQYLLATAL